MMRHVLRPVHANVQKYRSQASAIGVSCCGAALYSQGQSSSPVWQLDNLAAVVPDLSRGASVVSGARDSVGATACVVPLTNALQSQELGLAESDTVAGTKLSLEEDNDACSQLRGGHMQGYFPATFVLCPVMPWPVPVVAYLGSDSSCSYAATGMLVESPSLLNQPLSADQVEHQVAQANRTGASRRQRRRERMQANYSKVGATALSDIHEQLGQNAEYVSQVSASDSTPTTYAENYSSKFWPATPESTPPQTPRGDVDALQTAETALRFSEFPKLSEVQAAQILVQLSGCDLRLQSQLVEQIIEHAWPMSATSEGCRIVQKAVEIADSSQRTALVEQLRGHIVEAAESPYANHVVQRCIEYLPTERTRFVITELQGSVVNVAKNRYGCRVLERIIEHFPNEQTDHLVLEILSSTEKLCRHAFGNFVIQHILEHGTPSQRHSVVAVLANDAMRLAKHRVASHVLKAALVRCSPEDRQLLIVALAEDTGSLSELAHHHCGSFVMREVRRTTNCAKHLD